MKKPFTYTAGALLALSIVLPAMARSPQENMNQGKAAEEANAQRAQQMQAQQNQQREAQVQQQERQQAEARQNQEQAIKAQEEQARQSQMNAIRMQQTEAKQAQEQMRQQAQMQKDQQQQRNQATQMQKEQQEHNQAAQMQKEQQAHNQAAQMQKEQQERNQAAALQRDRVSNAQLNHQNIPANINERMPGNERPPQGATQQAEQREEHDRGGAQIAAQGQHMNPGASFVRATKPRAITANVIPTAKAVSMPVLEPGATAQEQQHAAAATKNLQAHLIAMPGNQAPQNFSGLRNTTVNSYFNNFRTTVNNRQVSINRQNTNFYNVPQTQFPHWWQPASGWTYSNGFTLGSLPCGADWLGWGWHPYWGPPPEGFVCESDYVPTPWFYIPAAGLWRQPGVMGYADYGPPYDYEGPITVEVMEPRHVQVRDPFTGWMNDRVVNVVYFYNAYYYPEFERYGYMNKHGYFIWLNLDDPDDY